MFVIYKNDMSDFKEEIELIATYLDKCFVDILYDITNEFNLGFDIRDISFSFDGLIEFARLTDDYVFHRLSDRYSIIGNYFTKDIYRGEDEYISSLEHLLNSDIENKNYFEGFNIEFSKTQRFGGELIPIEKMADALHKLKWILKNDEYFKDFTMKIYQAHPIHFGAKNFNVILLKLPIVSED